MPDGEHLALLVRTGDKIAPVIRDRDDDLRVVPREQPVKLPEQVIDAIPGVGGDHDRSALGQPQPLHLDRVGLVGLVDHHDLGNVADADLGEHLADGCDLGPRIGIGAVDDVQDQFRVGDLFQCGPERVDELMRQMPDEAPGAGERDGGARARRPAGSSVANSESSTSTCAPVSRLSRLDLPALVYPAIATEGTSRLRRCPRCTSRPTAISASSRRSLVMRDRIRRRSVSIFVSPGPRVPIPPPPATRPPACRDSVSPQPRSRGSRYCSCASSTWALPSLLRACWAKMSRISAVRSTTLTRTMPSSLRSWLAASSPSQMTVSAPVDVTSSASSAALPAPT